MPNLPQAWIDILVKLILSLGTLLLTVLITKATQRLFSLHIADRGHRRTLQMLLRNTLWVLSSVIILAIWLGFGDSFTVAMGILGAGIAFASQEVIGSFAGYLNIVTSNLFRIGDRVRVGDVVGDVLDIGVLRTTVMEIGEWVHADQYTGRVVTVANRVVFSQPVYNYTRDWPYIWDEIMLPVTYESDWHLAEEIMLSHAQDYTQDWQAQAQSQLAKMGKHYTALQQSGVAPSLYVRMTDNWIELTLRYVVDARERRPVMAQLHNDLLTHFSQEEGITVASSTYEIVGFPPLRQLSSEQTKGTQTPQAHDSP